MASGDSTRATTQRTTKTDSVETWDDLIYGGHAENIRERLQNDLAALLRKWRRRLRHYNVLVLYVLEKSLDETETDQIYDRIIVYFNSWNWTKAFDSTFSRILYYQEYCHE